MSAAYSLLFFRLSIAGLFLWSGLSKLLSEVAGNSLYGTFENRWPVLSYQLVVAEIVVGLCILIPGVLGRWAAAATVALGGVFQGSLFVWIWRGGSSAGCGCGGVVSQITRWIDPALTPYVSMVVSTVMIALAFFVIVQTSPIKRHDLHKHSALEVAGA